MVERARKRKKFEIRNLPPQHTHDRTFRELPAFVEHHIILTILTYDTSTLRDYGIPMCIAESWSISLARGHIPNIDLEGKDTLFNSFEAWLAYVDIYCQNHTP